jgi:alpha-L-rhamnosidase
MANNERIDEGLIQHDWKRADFDDSSWESGIFKSLAEKMLPALNPWTLSARPIPMLPEINKTFSSVAKCSGPIEKKEWSDFLLGDSPVTIPARTVAIVDIATECLTTGFIVLDGQKGACAEVKVLYSECYEKDLGQDRFPFPYPRAKSDRTNFATGRLYGTEDFYIVGQSAQDHTFEPFWFRTFRYVQLHITTADEDLQLTRLKYRETHYPLEISTQIKVSPELDSMWDISLRTLKNCMHETYEDCPFYEQNQFVCDARLQMLFTYQLSPDDRLARKTLEEFHASRCPDGLVRAQFPAGFKATQIPMFSLFYILMVHDHMLYFGDKFVARRYMSTLDTILNYYDCQLNDLGLIGHFDEEAWAFFDWVKAWETPMIIKRTGMPPAYWKTGAATVFSLVYSMALLHAAEICEFLDRCDTAEEYRVRSKHINATVNRLCVKDGVYLDGPGACEYSQHPQIFAVLCGAITGSAARKLMERTIRDSSLAPCSYAMKFYLFRAAEKVGLYAESFDALVQPWRMMMAHNLTTWCENDTSVRSDCHGWSSTPIYETVTGVFGLKPTAPGFTGITIEPRRTIAQNGRACLWTPRGSITVEWTDSEDLTLEATDQMEVELVLHGLRTTVQLFPGHKVYSKTVRPDRFTSWKFLHGISSWLYKYIQ